MYKHSKQGNQNWNILLFVDKVLVVDIRGPLNSCIAAIDKVLERQVIYETSIVEIEIR